MSVFYEFLHNVSTELSTDIVENCEPCTLQTSYGCSKLNCAKYKFAIRSLFYILRTGQTNRSKP